MSLLHSRREALSSYMFFFLMVPKFIVLLQKYLEELNPRNLLENIFVYHWRNTVSFKEKSCYFVEIYPQNSDCWIHFKDIDVNTHNIRFH